MRRRNGKSMLSPDVEPSGVGRLEPFAIIRAEVLARAKWRCQECGRAGKLTALPKGANPQPTARSYRAVCEGGCPEGVTP